MKYAENEEKSKEIEALDNQKAQIKVVLLFLWFWNDDLDKSRELFAHEISLLRVEKDISFLLIVQQEFGSFWECKF